jgi:hypothetical protein
VKILRNSTANKITGVIIYLLAAFSLFYLGTKNLITQDMNLVAIVLTVLILVVAVTKINKNAKRRQLPQPSQLEKY